MLNSTIKLSDKCRDNFFRTANCGIGTEFPQKIRNVHIIGVGECRLVGADRPRATGDGGKILANPLPCDGNCEFSHSYGTDCGTSESQKGDWRNIGILFARTENFSVKNLNITDSHCWGISLEDCSYGFIEKINFDSDLSKTINGVRHNIKNQDGVDLRNGCHDITVSDITGKTGDDVIALTAIADAEFHTGGSLETAHVMHNDWSKREKNIYNITIKNVTAYSEMHSVIRLLPVNSHISNVRIDGITDAAPQGNNHRGTILFGYDGGYGKVLPNSMRAIAVSNVICGGNVGVTIGSGLCDSAFSNVVQAANCKALFAGTENAVNTDFINCVTLSDG